MPKTQINELNRLEYSNRQGYSKFNLSRPYPTTLRFAQLTPFFLERTVLGDKFNIKVNQQIVNYVTMNSPLMGNLRFHNDFFAVPKEGMMPHTHDLLFRNPNKGDDVPDNAYPFFDLRSFVKKMVNVIDSMQEGIKSSPANDYYFKLLLLLYHMSGYGTLPDFFDDRSAAHNGSDLQPFYETSSVESKVRSFGYFFDKYWSSVFSSLNGESLIVNLFEPDGSQKVLASFKISSPADLRAMFIFLCDFDKDWSINYPDVVTVPDNALKNEHIFGSIHEFAEHFANYSSYGVDDILQYVAYQMVASQFFTVDTVDSVFNYKLWRQNMEALAHNVAAPDAINAKLYPSYFQYNGISYQYDVFSNFVVENLISSFLYYGASYGSTGSHVDIFFSAFSFFINLFSMRNTLRHLDYFAGARTQPLAVGDVSAPVSDSQVSAIDVTKSISMQRFLNAVNRARQDVSDYAKSIFGVDVPRDNCAPRALSSEVFQISDIVNINTADNQGDRKANIDTKASKFAFDMQFNQECYVIGLSYFDYILCNPFSVSRFNFHKDRFDDFQPMLQDIGDQIVYNCERTGVVSGEDGETVFAYQLQDAEYKFPVPTAHGGVVNYLPSWFFIDYMTFNKDNIDSDYIRIKPYYFDRYFSAISGCSLESYFHFIVSYNIEFNALRKMQFKPGILQQ